MLGNLSIFLLFADFFFQNKLFHKLFQEYNAIRVSTSLDPVQARHFVDLISDQTVCKAYKQITLAGQLKEIYFLISQPKHMLWVLKRTLSTRPFF